MVQPNIFKRFIKDESGTFDPEELWNNLKRILGRDPTDQELIEGMERQGREGEQPKLSPLDEMRQRLEDGWMPPERTRNIDDAVDDLIEGLETRNANESMVNEIKQRIEAAQDSETARKNREMLGAVTDNLEDPRHKAVFDELYQLADRKYYQITAGPDMSRLDEANAAFIPPEQMWTADELARAEGKWDVFDPSDGEIIAIFNSEAEAQNFIDMQSNRDRLDVAPHDARHLPDLNRLDAGELTDFNAHLWDQAGKQSDIDRLHARARELGLNPDNYVSNGELSRAIEVEGRIDSKRFQAENLVREGKTIEADTLISQEVQRLYNTDHADRAERLADDWQRFRDNFNAPSSLPPGHTVRRRYEIH